MRLLIQTSSSSTNYIPKIYCNLTPFIAYNRYILDIYFMLILIGVGIVLYV